MKNQNTLITEYQNRIITTTKVLDELENDYKNGSKSESWGKKITEEFYKRMSLGYNVEIHLYKEFILELETFPKSNN